MERKLIRPDVVIAMGATAVRSAYGRSLAINKIRGRLYPVSGGYLPATIHPSYILRIEDRSDRHAQYHRFVADIRACTKALAKGASL